MRSKTKTFYWRQSPQNAFQYSFYTNSHPENIHWTHPITDNLVLSKGQTVASSTTDGKQEFLKMPFSGRVLLSDHQQQPGSHLLFQFEKCDHVPILGESKIETCQICGDELFSYEAK